MSQSDHEENRSLKRILSKLPDLLREELDEITRAKVDNISDNTLGLLAVMPLEAMAVSDFPLHELLALSEDRRIIDIGEKIIFLAMLKLANGIETSWQQRYLVSEWARQRLADAPGGLSPNGLAAPIVSSRPR
jgi:hypothetical protein